MEIVVGAGTLQANDLRQQRREVLLEIVRLELWSRLQACCYGSNRRPTTTRRSSTKELVIDTLLCKVLGAVFKGHLYKKTAVDIGADTV